MDRSLRVLAPQPRLPQGEAFCSPFHASAEPPLPRAGAGAGASPPRIDSVVADTHTRSDGEAAYADRAMDGSKFARENYGIKYSRTNIGTFCKDSTTKTGKN